MNDEIKSAQAKGHAPRRKYRLAILMCYPVHYFSPLCRELAECPEIDLTVYYCSRHGVSEFYHESYGRKIAWETPLLDGYKYKFLRNVRSRDSVHGFLSLINPGIIRELRRCRYDALWINGHARLSEWLALLSARLLGIPVLYRSESSLTYDRMTKRPRALRCAKQVVLRLLFGQVTSCLAIGTLNREYYLHHGVHPSRIYSVPYAVDNEYFMRRTEQLRDQRNQVRSEMGIGLDDVVFLFVGRLIEHKGVLELLEAYRRMRGTSGKGLIIVGAGKLRKRAQAYIDKNELRGVHFTGFVSQAELPKFYAVSDVAVRPDVRVYHGDWGLTVNEALAAGLAVICTDGIGATADLVRNGENGFAVRFREVSDLVSAMQSMVDNPDLCRRMGHASRKIIAGWTYAHCVEGVLQALKESARRTL